MPHPTRSWYANAATLLVLVLSSTRCSGPSTEEAGPQPNKSAPQSCIEQAWWSSDELATAEPGNLLTMHTRCLVDDKVVVPGGTLRRVWGADPSGLNIYASDGNSSDVVEIYRYISNRLAYRQVADPSRFSPELAQSITSPDGGLTYIIRLRQGVQWQAPDVPLDDPRYAWLKGPHELTADDYLFVFELLQDETVSGRFSGLRGSLGGLLQAVQVDTYTFKLVFDKRTHSRFSNLSVLEPLPRWLYAYDEDGHLVDKARFGEVFSHHWYADRGIGTGPYRLTEWKPGEGIKLERNQGYWGEPPAFDRVRLKIIKDKAAWPREFGNRDLDWVFLAPNQYNTTVLQAPGGKPFDSDHVKTANNAFFGYFYVGWDVNDPRFVDRRVREALTLAVDRAAILKYLYFGLGELISGPLTPHEPCYDSSIQPHPYDPVEAARLLTEAGWVDGDGDGVREKVIDGKSVPLEFSLLSYAGSEEWKAIANQLVESWQAVGVRATVEAVDWATQQSRTKRREFDAYTGSWLDDYEFEPGNLFHSRLADKEESLNYVGYRNPEFDALSDAYSVNMDETSRLEQCHQLHRIIHEDAPYMFLFSRETPVLWWDTMNDIEMFPTPPNRDLRFQSFVQAPP